MEAYGTGSGKSTGSASAVQGSLLAEYNRPPWGVDVLFTRGAQGAETI
jgi:hypothetical protein